MSKIEERGPSTGTEEEDTEADYSGSNSSAEVRGTSAGGAQDDQAAPDLEAESISSYEKTGNSYSKLASSA